MSVVSLMKIDLSSSMCSQLVSFTGRFQRELNLMSWVCKA